MEKGHNYEQRLKNAKRFGRPVDHLRRPELRPDVQWVFAEFWKLHTCREWTSAGYGYIPYLRVMEFADRKGYDADTAEEFWEMIHSMDCAMIQHEAKKASE